MNPKVTVLMPVYNGMPFIPEAVDSVLVQDLSDWRLIISDNLSSDETRPYLRQLATMQDPRIDIYFQSENLGIFGNLNFLFDRACPDSLLHILCADDTFAEHSSLRSLVKSLESISIRHAVVRWNGSFFLSQGLPLTLAGSSAQLLFFLFGNLMGSLSCVSCKGDPRRLAGSFDQGYPYVGDFEFWSRFVASGGTLMFKTQDIVVVRSHAGQASKYLNLKGEKYLEQSRVVSRIFRNLHSYVSPAYGFLLSLAGTLIYDSPWRFSAIRAAQSGRPDLLDSLNSAADKSPFIFNAPWRQLVWFFSMGGLLLKHTIIRISLRLAPRKLAS